MIFMVKITNNIVHIFPPLEQNSCPLHLRMKNVQDFWCCFEFFKFE